MERIPPEGGEIPPSTTFEKRCPKCSGIGDIFGKDKLRKDGLSNYCRRCRANGSAEYRRMNRTAVLQRNKERWAKQKLETIKNYGGSCVCCKENNPAFLTLDHVNNDGAAHRKEIWSSKNSRGGNMWWWAKKNNYPNSLQLLCFNCNCGRDVNGGTCPHKQKLTLVA